MTSKFDRTAAFAASLNPNMYLWDSSRLLAKYTVLLNT